MNKYLPLNRAIFRIFVFLNLTYFTYSCSIEGYFCTWSHSMTHTHSVGLLRTRNQPVAKSLPENTQHSHETDIRAPCGIRTSNPSKWAAADLTRSTARPTESNLVETFRSKYLFLLFPVLCIIQRDIPRGLFTFVLDSASIVVNVERIPSRKRVCWRHILFL